MSVVYRGNGFSIEENKNTFQISFQQGPFGKIVYYDISTENMYKAMKSDEDAYEVMIYAQTGKWPDTNSIERDKEFIRKFPKLLLKNAKNQELFDSQELEELMKQAKER